jgi:hypothetical protein
VGAFGPCKCGTGSHINASYPLKKEKIMLDISTSVSEKKGLISGNEWQDAKE